MAWWKSSRKRVERKRIERKVTLGLTESTGAFLIFGENNATTPAGALALYEKSTAVSVPINFVADAFSVVPPVLKVGDEIVRDHPILSFLKKPSPFYSTELLLEVLSKDYLITGEMSLVALGDVNRPPLQLQPLSPRVMTPVREQSNDVASSWSVAGNTLAGVYRATPSIDAPKVRYLDISKGEPFLRELSVTRNYSTLNNALLRGQSLLVSAAKEARSHILGTEHNVSLLEKGGRVSLVFNFKEDLDEDNFNELRDRVRAQYGGSSKAGEIGIASGEHLEIKELGMNNKDMDWAGLQMMAVKAVALLYHVPLPLVTEQRQTFNNYREAKLALYDDAVIPLSCRVYGGLSAILMPRFGLDPTKATLAMDLDAVTALVMRRNEELKKRQSIGIETDNELRSLIGREPYEGGDVVLKPATFVPAGTDIFTDDEDPAKTEGPPALGGTRDE